ncbi:hypothetical protein B4U37_13180 [Sutcliffiella horikoshii]|uniref:Uncharacterized protein n=1 Tax=Sutcliffiella horikoshii TaxID=79883 RepID=A0ABM6KQ71_9BACI|nr:hypothetical protein B4U37_13180 [Sutcliffiella horikoshii]
MSECFSFKNNYSFSVASAQAEEAHGPPAGKRSAWNGNQLFSKKTHPWQKGGAFVGLVYFVSLVFA